MNHYTSKQKRRIVITVVSLLLIPLITIGAYYTITLRTKAQSCYTVTQVQNDSRCLYIYKTGVYEKGTRAAPHKNNPCGSDITSIIPDSHLLDKIGHLDPNYLGDLCAASPSPTNTPIPSNSPIPTATLTPQPSASPTPSPTSAPTAVPVNQSTITQTPTVTPIFTVTPTFTLTPSPTQTLTPTPLQTTITITLTPTPIVSVNPTINLTNAPVTGDSSNTPQIATFATVFFIIGALGLLLL